MKAAKLPVPQFFQRIGAYDLVRVVWRNNSKTREVWVDSDASTIVGADLAKDLTAEELRAVNYIASHGKANTSDIKRLLRRDWDTARKILERLTAKKVLKHIHRTDLVRDPRAHFVLANPDKTITTLH